MERLARESPLVVLDPQPRIETLTTLCVDDEAGGFPACRHLLEPGHGDLAVVTAPPKPSSALRLAGYERALAAGEAGREPADLSGQFQRGVGRPGGGGAGLSGGAAAWFTVWRTRRTSRCRGRGRAGWRAWAPARA